MSRNALVAIVVALASSATVALAQEPPAYPTTPPPRVKPREAKTFVVEVGIQEAWGAMGDWKDAMDELESRASAAGLPVRGSNNPAYTTSFDAIGLARLAPRLYLGLHYDRMTAKSRFDVRESIEPGGIGGSTEFPTQADGESNAWMGTLRWMIPGDRRGVRPFLQIDAGAGSARFDFASSGAVAQAKGHGFAGSAELGLQVGDGPFRARFATGYRAHRVPLSYRRVAAGSQPGLSRYFFDFNDELRDFVAGRELDFSGPFARLGVALEWSR